jgi:hypothetical protein
VVAVSEDELPSISIVLSPAQVHDVLIAAGQTRARGLSALLGAIVVRTRSGTDGPRELSEQDAGGASSGILPSKSTDRRLSLSLLRGLSLLTCFDAEGQPRGIVGVAEELGMSSSTAHRHALTLVHVGLLERSPQTRKYSLPMPARDENA